jgi:broad specificity phosphatase PhoE
MTTLVLMRHGETVWNREGRYLSRTDIPLDDEGLRGVRTAAGSLVSLRSPLLVSSPMLRAQETASVVADTLGVTGFEVWEELREIDFGVFEGETEASASRGPYAEEFRAWRDPSSGNPGAPGGESWTDVDVRTRRVLARLEEAGRDSVVVSHGCFLRAVLAHAVLGTSSHQLRRLRLDNAAFAVLTGSPGNWVIAGQNVRTLPYE